MNDQSVCEKCGHNNVSDGEKGTSIYGICVEPVSDNSAMGWPKPKIACACKCEFPVDSGNRDRPTRHPLAVAWDEWLVSEEGAFAANPDTLGTVMPHTYLEHRLHRAFDAGVKAAENQGAKQ